jgi:hypothetical protein
LVSLLCEGFVKQENEHRKKGMKGKIQKIAMEKKENQTKSTPE